MTNQMQQELTERKLHELDVAVDDLTSLAHSPGCATVIGQYNLQDIERRIRDLRLDVQSLSVAAE